MEKTKMPAEMLKFRKLLNDNKIAWKDNSSILDPPGTFFCSTDIFRTHFEWRGYKWSVINGYGSYGGWDDFHQKNQGLLELMSNAVNGGEPVGFLTADDCITLVLAGTDWQEVANEHE